MADDTKTAKPNEAGDSAVNSDATSEGKDPDKDPDDEFPGSELDESGLDPELISLPRQHTLRIGPLMSVSVLVFCIYIAMKVYPDLRFSRNSDRPTHYDSVADLVQKASPESLVSIDAVPDRTFAVHVSHSQADDGSRLTPAQGSDGKLWLLIGGNVWNQAIGYDELYAGRLRLLADMPFYEELQKHVRARPPGARFVKAADLRAALDGPRTADAPIVLTEPAGDRIEVRPDTPVQIYETLANRVRILMFTTDRLPKKSDLTGALQAAGLVPEGYEPKAGLPKTGSWVYVVDVPGGVAAARAKLQEHKLFSASCSPVKRLHESTLGALKSAPRLLTIGANPVLWQDVIRVSVEVPRTIPDGAWVLLTMEHPDTYWYVLPLFVFLALAILFFLYALIRAVKPG